MKTNSTHFIEVSYRRYYGKLFAALFNQFGARYVNEIEDAIQNAFYKSLRTWKPQQIPKQPENWLFIVARNDVINQIKKQQRIAVSERVIESPTTPTESEDLRLKMVLWLVKCENISAKVKVLFILKNIFGLHTKEISACTLISEAAIYKSIKRAKGSFLKVPQQLDFADVFAQVAADDVVVAEEIFYAVFNIGFDSFSDKSDEMINEELCVEALALVKMLWRQYEQVSTQNLLALFCFNLARIPARVQAGKFIPFFEQDRNQWSQEFIQLGFHYLEQPLALEKYYLQALITSKHMTAKSDDSLHWNAVVELYELLLKLIDSPIAKLNLAYALSRAERVVEAKELMANLEQDLPQQHIYFSLVKNELLQGENQPKSAELIQQVLTQVSQKIRREYILEQLLVG